MTFIIAELGVNFRNLNEADEMIREAAAAGANACKFQCYKPDMVDGNPRRRELIDIILDESAIRYLYWRCLEAGVEFLCTPMYVEAVDMLDPYVKRWKIRYIDRDNEELVRKCVLTGKPMLISGKNIFCIPEYPPGIPQPIPDNPEYIGISHHFPKVTGLDLTGWTYFEVHVKRDHYPDNYCPIDNAVSITMSELAELCRRVK